MANSTGNARSKTWIYTLNNFLETEVEQLRALETQRHRCCIETGETGTIHLQGTIVFKTQYRLTQLKKLLPRAHWEVCKFVTTSFNYCTKGTIIIDTDNTNQGKRSDVLNAIEHMKTGGIKQVARETPLEYLKFHRGLLSIIEDLYLPIEIDTRVIVYWGKSGSGKSRAAWDYDPNLYNVPEPINGSVWFNGYSDQKTILLDDFYGWLKYHTLLQYTDRYPFQVPTKGGFVHRKWNTVIITSNEPPDKWYQRHEIDALSRRIYSITHFEREMLPKSALGNTNRADKNLNKKINKHSPPPDPPPERGDNIESDITLSFD